MVDEAALVQAIAEAEASLAAEAKARSARDSAAAAPAPLTPRSSPAFLLGVTLDKKGNCVPRDNPPRPRPGHAGLQLQLARGPRPGAARHGEGAPSAQRAP